MQLTFRVHLPKGITVKEERTAKRIEKFLIKEVKSKFGNQITLSDFVAKHKTTKPRKLTLKQKKAKHKQITNIFSSELRDCENQRQTQRCYDIYWQQVSRYSLERQANVTKLWLKQEMEQQQRRGIRRNRNG